MTILNTYIKQPAENLDYDIDYSDFLSTGDSIAYGSASVSPVGLTLQTPMVVGKTLKLWVSGGTDKITYKVTINMTTTQGRIKQDEIVFKVKDI